TGDGRGTPAFMPPEQLTGFREARPAADQYSAAATLYWLLTQRQIFDLGPREQPLLFKKIMQEDPVPILDRRPDLPAPVADAITQALRKKPEHRFQDVPTLQQALRPFARD